MNRVACTLALAACLAVTRTASGQQTTEMYVRQAPDQARDSIASALRTGLAGAGGSPVSLEAARHLASAYSDVWGDPFLAERVRWATALPARDRRLFLQADSLRRVANDQFFREGPAQARSTWRQAGRRFGEIGDSVGTARILGNVGASFYEEGALDSAVAYLSSALAAAERLGDRRSAGNAATILGNVAQELGDLRTAIEFNLRAASLHEAAGDYSGVAADHNSAGLIAEALGDLESARGHYETALRVSERHTDGERAPDYLLNLGVLAARQLAIEEARAYLERALALYRWTGETVNQALAHRNIGSLEAGVSAYDAALVELRHALALYRRVEDARGEAEVRRLMASVFSAMGRVDEALEEIGRAESLLGSPQADPALAASVAVVRGDIELTVNRVEEAAASFETAQRLYQQIDDPAGLAAASQGRAHLHLVSGRFEELVRDLKPVATLQPAGRERAWSNLLLGIAHAELGDSGAAQVTLTGARDEFLRAGDRAGAAVALGARAEYEARRRRPQRALRLLEDARHLASDLPAIEWWLHLRMGRTLEAVRELDGAAAHYDSATTIIEGLADWVRFDDRRAMYLEDKWEAYAALARLWARRGNAERALRVSERLRARYLLDQLARRRNATRSEGSLRAEERRLSRRIDELTAEMLTTDAEQRGPSTAGSAEAREELLATQAAYRRLLDRMRDEEPDYVRELRGTTVSVEAIQAELDPDQILLEYLVSEDQLWIFAVTSGDVAQVSVAIGHSALRAQIDFSRWALEAGSGRDDLWRGALRRLDDVLIAPVRRAGLLAGRQTIIIVPHLELHYLPFEILINAGSGSDRFLVESYDVVYAPSASVWLHPRPPADRGRGGVLALAPLEAELVGTAAEVEAIRTVWGPAAEVWRDSAASKASLLASGSQRILHLATRGVLNRHNPLFSYIELYPDGEDDGRLEVHEVLQQRMPADLVVLSACQTALGAGSVGDVPKGDDWVGLVRAFLHAGADNVLATLWAVDDLRTAKFVGVFHRRLAQGVSYGHALAAAKREAIQTPGLQHPYFWAGFVLTGRADD